MYSVFPERLTDEQVRQIVGRDWTCPWCRAESTHENRPEYGGWVYTPLRRHEPRFICLGCCDDIYSTCARPDFESHPYYDYVAEAAEIEGMDVSVFRLLCIRHQVELGKRKLQEGRGASWLPGHMEYLERLLEELERRG